MRHGPWPPPRALDAGNAQPASPRPSRLASACSSTHACRSMARCRAPAATAPSGLRRRPRARRWAASGRSQHADAVGTRCTSAGTAGTAPPTACGRRAIRPMRRRARNGPPTRRTWPPRSRGDAELACRYAQAFGAAAGGDDEAVLVECGQGARRLPARCSRAARRSTTSATRWRAATAALLPAIRCRRSAARARSSAGGAATCATSGRCSATASSATPALPFFVAAGRRRSRAPRRHRRSCKPARTTCSARYSDDADAAAAIKTRHVEAQHRNFGEFKVPGLRNVALTAPYMHDGSLATLRRRGASTIRRSTSSGCTPTASASSSRCT